MGKHPQELSQLLPPVLFLRAGNVRPRKKVWTKYGDKNDTDHGSKRSQKQSQP